MDEAKITIRDSIENLSSITTPLMIIYHMNFGFLLLDSSACIIGTAGKPLPITDEAAKNISDFSVFADPVKDFSEHVFCHDIPAGNDGCSNIALINEEFNSGQGLGVLLKYKKETLPYLNQWKQAGFGEYVLGLEPANCRTYGRKLSREKGGLEFIEPGEVKEYTVELNILKDLSAIDRVKKLLK